MHQFQGPAYSVSVALLHTCVTGTILLDDREPDADEVKDRE